MWGNRLRTLGLAGVVVVAAVWSVQLGRGAGVITSRTVRIDKIRNGQPGAGLPFRYQPFGEPLLGQLGRRERLDAVVAGAAGEFEKILRIKDWVAAQWPKSEPNPYPPWNALVILDWIRAGKTGGFCAQYSQVFVQSLAYLGLTARYVEIGSRDNPYRHYPTEVWSNDFDKWVLMDVDFNLHFERGGVPLSALEVHRALVNQATEGILPVLGAVRRGHGDPNDYPQKTMELYYYLRFHLRADQLSHPQDPFNRMDDMVEWEDSMTVPWERSSVPSPFPKERLTRRATSVEAGAYPKLNQVVLTPRRLRGDVLEVVLTSNVFDFAGYEVAETAAGSWKPWEKTSYPWALVPGRNVLRVRGRNTRGVTGPPAELVVTRIR